jgi:hypothetical protein
VGEGDLAIRGRTAAALDAYLVFEDEAGFSMTPPTARTWSHRGNTPIVRVRGRTQRRISIAALACYKTGERSRLIYRPIVHADHKAGGRRSFASPHSPADLAAIIRLYGLRPWCAEISPCVRPFADSESTISSTPVSRRCRFLTMAGSKEPSRSRCTSIPTGPMSVSTVLDRVPLRELPPSLPAGSCLS